MTLLERIDLALQHVQLSRTELAAAIGVSRQAINNLKRRPTSSLRIENVAEAARVLRCDWYWLFTGKGDYAPDVQKMVSDIAWEVAKMVDELPAEQQVRVCALVFMASKGHWPELHPTANKKHDRSKP